MDHGLAIVGGGRMGTAIARGVLVHRLLPPERLLVVDRDPARGPRLEPLGCPISFDPADARRAESMLLCVKPQHFAALAQQLGPLDRPMVVGSIMAGIESAAIRAALGEHARVVRIMPNTPCQVGEGMTVLALGDGARPGDESLLRETFAALGRTAMLEEPLMHAVTAVSGSGPAYVYLVAELMRDAARALGLDESAARLLVEQTLVGAARMIRETGEDPEALRAAVTTPGGTTAAAIELLEARGVRAAFLDALAAARDRGAALGA